MSKETGGSSPTHPGGVIIRYGLRSLPFVVALVALVLAGCSRPPELIGIDNPVIPAASVPDLDRH